MPSNRQSRIDPLILDFLGLSLWNFHPKTTCVICPHRKLTHFFDPINLSQVTYLRVSNNCALLPSMIFLLKLKVIFNQTEKCFHSPGSVNMLQSISRFQNFLLKGRFLFQSTFLQYFSFFRILLREYYITLKLTASKFIICHDMYLVK